MKKVGYHGDVIFIQSDIPSGTIKVPGNLIQGSTTVGHEHIIKSGVFEIRKSKDSEPKTFLVAKSKVILGMKTAKNKHHDVKIPDGIYEFQRAIETDHIAGVIRQICD